MKQASSFFSVRACAFMLGGFLLAASAGAATHPLGWGLNANGQASPVPTNVMNDASAISAGYFHSLALKEERVWAWGMNTDGQASVPISAQSGVAQIAGGGVFSLALKTNGSVTVWGSGAVATNPPTSITSGVTQIAAGESHALVLKGGGVIAWGDNTYGQTNVPTSLTSGVTAISAGGFYSLALKAGGVQVFGIADTNAFEYGINSVPAAASNGVSAIAAGRWHALALKNGGVIAWGACYDGTNSFADATNVPAEATSGVTNIAAGDLFSIALKTNGTIVVWGDDMNGQRPIPNFASNGVSKIAAGVGHCLVVSTAMPPRYISSYTPDAFLSRAYTNGAYVLAAGDPAVQYHRSGAWPSWLTLDANTGALGGTPTVLGLNNFLIIASNSFGRVTNQYQINVLEKPPEPPIFLTTSLSNGMVGAAYAQQIIITNGGTFRIVEGSLPAGLALNTNTGWIVGTPVAVEAPQFRVLATNSAGSATNLFGITINPPAGAPVITTGSPLPNGVLGQFYSLQISAANYPTNFTVIAGALPAGLGLTVSGMVTGVPTQVESATFTISAVNMIGETNATYDLQVFGPPEFVTTSPLPNGAMGDPYAAQIETTTAATFDLFSGSLPGGLSLAADGWVTGTPTGHGLFSFVVRAMNAFGSSNRYFELTIDEQAGPPAFSTTNPLPSGVLGVAYSKQIVASGNPAYSLFAGILPGGLSLATNGWLTGIPTERGAFNFTVRATNEVGWSNRVFDLTVYGPPEFSTTNPLPTGVVGQPYSLQIEASDSPAYSVVAGSLPDGLSLSAAGLLDGTPTNQGAYNFIVRATNAYGWSNRVFDLSINARTLAVLSRAEVNVRENGQGRFYVVLDESPAVPTTVTVARVSGDADIDVQSGMQLVFTAANWNTWTNAVTLAAADDADATNGTATFQITAPGGATNLVATELDDDIGANLALASSGSTISGILAGFAGRAIDGIHLEATNSAYTIWTNDPPGTLTLDLKSTATVSRIRLLNYDWDARVQRYQIESSPDNATWSLVADASAGEHAGWEDWPVADETVRYLRFTGLSNSLSSFVRIAEWEVYGLLLGQQPPWFTDRPRYTNGALRLAWTNPNANGSVQVWQSTNITRSPPPWTNLGVQVSPWTNVAPTTPSYYRLILVP